MKIFEMLFTLHIINKSIETETCETFFFMCDDSETSAHPVNLLFDVMNEKKEKNMIGIIYGNEINHNTHMIENALYIRTPRFIHENFCCRNCHDKQCD